MGIIKLDVKEYEILLKSPKKYKYATLTRNYNNMILWEEKPDETSDVWKLDQTIFPTFCIDDCIKRGD